MNKPIFIFHAHGGFNQWSGSSLIKDGVGGSETWIIMTAKYIQLQGIYRVIVFCNCEVEEIYDNVEYKNLNNYFKFIKNNKIDTCIISRYPEYLPATYLCHYNISKVYLIFHDLIQVGEIIIDNPILKKIFCLSKYHEEFVKNMFPSLCDKIDVIGYGIDTGYFQNQKITKIPFKFIYSSFANRGLLKILKLWPKIIEKFPKSSLHIHCDIENEWLNSCVPDEMNEIKYLLKITKQIVFHGWTNKKKLYENWITSDIWFYPTSFLETFCLTAYEAMVSKTLIVCSDIGSLKNTVSEYGIFIVGDPNSKDFDENALNTLFSIMNNPDIKEKYIQMANKYVLTKTWETQTNLFLNKILN